MRRSPAAVALAATVLLLVPVACGADSEQSYCDALTARQTLFSQDSGPQELVENLSALEKLGKKAPDDLSDEWQVFLDALEGLQGAIAAAHVKPGDISGGKPPSGVSDAQWDAIKNAANGLSAPAVDDALEGIGQQARDVCKLQLGLS